MSSASSHPILDQMQVPLDFLVDADALEQALAEAMTADPSPQLPAPSPADQDMGFTVAGPGSTGYALSFGYQPRAGAPGRLDLLARTYLWTLSGAEQTLSVELTYPGSGNSAVRRVTVVNHLGQPAIDITYNVEAGVPPGGQAETLTRHPSLAEVLGAPAVPEEGPTSAAVPGPAADPADRQPADPTARVEIVHPQDDETWWQELVAQLRSAVGAGLEHALGQVSGLTLAMSGAFVDPVLWATSPEAKRAAVDSFLDLLPVTVPPPLRTAVEAAVSAGDTSLAGASAPSGLSLLRWALTAAGYADPYTGAPALSPAISALTTAIDKNVIQPLFGAPDPDAMITPLEAGQLEGELVGQVALAFSGVKEVEVALTVLGGLSLIKSITDLMAKDDKQHKPWLTDPAFLPLVVSGVLYAVGLRSAMTNKKLVAAIANFASSALATSPAVIQLSNDWAAPESPGKEKAVHDDILALFKALALLLLPVIGMARKKQPPERPTGRREITTQRLNDKVERTNVEQEHNRLQEAGQSVQQPADYNESIRRLDRIMEEARELAAMIPADAQDTADSFGLSLSDEIDIAEGSLKDLDSARTSENIQTTSDAVLKARWRAHLEYQIALMPSAAIPGPAQTLGEGLGYDRLSLLRLAYDPDRSNYNFDELASFLRGEEARRYDGPLSRSWLEDYDFVDANGDHLQGKAYRGRAADGDEKTPSRIRDDIMGVANRGIALYVDLTGMSVPDERQEVRTLVREAGGDNRSIIWLPAELQ